MGMNRNMPRHSSILGERIPMQASPLISVVIPTYNSPDYLIQTLETVLAQTFTDFEIVIINDGSTDNTAQRLEPYLKRIRLITQSNGGIGAARNRGIDAARGKYVALLDHDDLWTPEKLQLQIAYFQKHPQCSMVMTCFAESTRPDFPINAAVATHHDGLVTRPLGRFDHRKFLVMTSGIMFERERATGIRFATERDCIEDQPFFLKMYPLGPVGVVGEAPLMIYRVHSGSYSRRPDFWFNGIKKLREMDRDGEFRNYSMDQRRDLDRFLAGISRLAATVQLQSGRHEHALELFRREKIHWLRNGHWRFLTSFPFKLIACRMRIRRQNNQARPRI